MLLLPAFAGVALASPIVAPATIGTPDSGPATANPAAIHYNPAAIGGTEGVDVLVDLQASKIDVEVTATRNDGIDPNTGEPYGVSEAHVVVPVGLVGVTWKPLKWLAGGFAVTDSYVGGGDYTASETDPPPYTGHQRYAGIKTQIITLAMMPAVAITPIDGLHVGGGVSYVYDKVSIMKASDPLGSEGYDFIGQAGYANDVLLSADASGGHVTWNAGVYFDKLRWLQVGVSYAAAGKIATEGTVDVTAPDFLATGSGDVTIPGQFAFDMPLPPVIRAGVASDLLDDKLRLGATFEYFMWNACCGGPEGDARIVVLSEDGDAIGAEDGLSISVAEESWSPRRLWNSATVGLQGGYWITDSVWAGTRLGYKQYAVPNYAVSATNLDYDAYGATLAARYRLKKKLTMGLSYTKNFLTPREITNSAWDVRDEEDANYVDERFSTANPYSASANGTYSAQSNIFGLTVGVDL